MASRCETVCHATRRLHSSPSTWTLGRGGRTRFSAGLAGESANFVRGDLDVLGEHARGAFVLIVERVQELCHRGREVLAPELAEEVPVSHAPFIGGSRAGRIERRSSELACGVAALDLDAELGDVLAGPEVP